MWGLEYSFEFIDKTCNFSTLCKFSMGMFDKFANENLPKFGTTSYFIGIFWGNL